MDEPLKTFGPWVGLVVVAVTSILATLRVAVPRLLDGYVEREKFKAQEEAKERAARRELQAEAVLGDQQEDVTLLSQMVNLTNQVVAQNRTLIGYITDNLSTDIAGLRNDMNKELHDIEQRWLAASREIADSRAKSHLLTIEVARLSDNYQHLDERIAYLVENGHRSSTRKRAPRPALGEVPGQE